MVKNCVKCGAILYTTIRGEKFCPNHGILEENQEWKKKDSEESKEKQENDD